MAASETDNRQFSRIQRTAWLAAGAGGLLSLLGIFLDLDQFFRSYLLSFTFWTGIALGCFVWLAIHFLAGGVWSLALRRLMEAGSLMTIVMALLFVPLVFGLDGLYRWSQPAAVAQSEILLHKRPYLNDLFFLARTAFYFVVWIALALLIRQWSSAEDRGHDAHSTYRLRLIGGPMLLIYGFTVTFASVDWIMSLEPEWYSTVFGAFIASGQAVTAFALMLIVLSWQAHRAPLVSLVQGHHIFQLGNLLLTSVILWGYLGFIQYLIIWAGNLPEEVLWYQHRLEGGWQWVALFFMIFHFGLPFAVLLMRDVRNRLDYLSSVALMVLAANFVHLFWLIAPTFHTGAFYLHWLDIVIPLAMGGLWVAVFLWLLGRRPLLPDHDRVLEDIRNHGIQQPPVTTAERRQSLH